MKIINFTDLNDTGEVLFITSGSYEVIVIAMIDMPEGRCLYHFSLDHNFDIMSFEEIQIDPLFFNHTYINWSKPYTRQGTRYYGCKIATEDGDYSVAIANDTLVGTLKPAGKFDNESIPSQSAMVSALNRYSVVTSQLVDDKLYFVGWDRENTFPVYGVADLLRDKVPFVYGLYSDEGIVDPLTITVNTDNRNVIIGGCYQTEGPNGTINKPYLERFHQR